MAQHEACVGTHPTAAKAMSATKASGFAAHAATSASSSEFAAIRLWTSPPHVLLIVAIVLLVNSRHLLMGATLAPPFRASLCPPARSWDGND